VKRRNGRVCGRVWEAIERNPPARKPLKKLRYSISFFDLGGLGGFPVPLTYTSLHVNLWLYDALCIRPTCAKPSQPSRRRNYCAKTEAYAASHPPKPSHKPSRPGVRRPTTWRRGYGPTLRNRNMHESKGIGFEESRGRARDDGRVAAAAAPPHGHLVPAETVLSWDRFPGTHRSLTSHLAAVWHYSNTAGLARTRPRDSRACPARWRWRGVALH
jgi:hypothetical protein